MFFLRGVRTPFRTKSLSAERTSSLCYSNSGDALRKKTSQPRIRTEVLDGLRGCQGSCACQGLSYVSKIIKIELTSHFGIEKTRELIARKYYGDLQLFPIPTHCWKRISYDLILVIVGQLTEMKHLLQFDPCHRRPASEDVTRQAGADTDGCTPASTTRLSSPSSFGARSTTFRLGCNYTPSSSTALTTYTFSTKTSNQNLMTICLARA